MKAVVDLERIKIIRTRTWQLIVLSAGFWTATGALSQSQKPRYTPDEFFNSTEIQETAIAPDASAAVISTIIPDWAHDRYREDLWLWTAQSSKTSLLTRSGHDSAPQWSPDGKYIAFLSDRDLSDGAKPDDSDTADKEDSPSRVWVIDPRGSEAFPLYNQSLDAHSFAWSSDSSIIVAVSEPLSKQQEEEKKRAWKDVVRWRDQKRGDVLLRIALPATIAALASHPLAHEAAKEPAPTELPYPRLATILAHSSLRIDAIAPAPAGGRVAFLTGPVSQWLEKPEDTEVFLVSHPGDSPKQLTHNQALESDLRWTPNGQRLYFKVAAAAGSLEGKYRDVQGRIYSLDPETGALERLGEAFHGSWDHYAVTSDGDIVAVGLTGVESQIYRVHGKDAARLPGVAGSYGVLQSAAHSSALLFIHSAIDEPSEVYLAADAAHMQDAQRLTNFNALFNERAAPQWKPYSWKADDGTTVEGVLMYPPGKLGEKHLRMLTLIHGGPADADGNRFGADWYDWAGLAATNGWLVFRPNYRGSSGYGDDFMLQIAPHLVSRPGKDILEGIDALVKDGIADPQHLAVGGYSYGGYMTNWLITQTTRFRSAVTGAGAVEHAANWGNDDLTFDDAWYLGGAPWENAQIYQDEAALFHFDKVTTPTHLVGGDADVRVSYMEDVLLERALEWRGIPHAFLSFPGEGHSLDKNPWHGYIKVREELKWLDHYDRLP